MTMGEEPTTTLTVAKLKALCVLNDVSASGKAELLARLLKRALTKKRSAEVYDESTATFSQPPLKMKRRLRQQSTKETKPTPKQHRMRRLKLTMSLQKQPKPTSRSCSPSRTTKRCPSRCPMPR